MFVHFYSSNTCKMYAIHNVQSMNHKKKCLSNRHRVVSNLHVNKNKNALNKYTYIWYVVQQRFKIFKYVFIFVLSIKFLTVLFDFFVSEQYGPKYDSKTRFYNTLVIMLPLVINLFQ